MRKLTKFLAGFFFAVAATTAAAQVQLVVTGAVGNGSDTAARFFAPILEKHLQKPVVVVNQPGADGVIGLRYFAEHAKRQEAILVGATAMGLVSHRKQMDIDPLQEFVPLHGMSAANGAVFVPANSPLKSMKDVAALYKTKQRVLIGSTGKIDDVTANQLSEVLGVPLEIVRYKNANQLATELVAGLLDMTIGTVGASAYQGMADSGLLRPIAIIDDTRNTSMPEVKTLIEQGYTSVLGARWTALFVHKDMPEALRLKFEKAVTDAMKSPEAAAYEKSLGAPKRFMANAKQVVAVQKQEAVILGRLYKPD